MVREFERGESPESLRSHDPTLTLEQVYRAIAFYLGNRDEVERDVLTRESEEDAYRAGHPVPVEISERVERMRRQLA